MPGLCRGQRIRRALRHSNAPLLHTLHSFFAVHLGHLRCRLRVHLPDTLPGLVERGLIGDTLEFAGDKFRDLDAHPELLLLHLPLPVLLRLHLLLQHHRRSRVTLRHLQHRIARRLHLPGAVAQVRRWCSVGRPAWRTG